MTLEPISIATKGYICFNGTDYCPDDIAIATKGYVCVADVPPVARLDGGDSSRRHKQMLDTSLDALLAREDEEIITIITTIGRRL